MTATKEKQMNTKIILRSALQGTVWHATIKQGRKVIYETRAWGAASNAMDDARAKAQELGLQVKE